MMSLLKIADDDELEECLAVNPAGIGQELVGRTRALSAWRELVKSPSFSCAVIKSREPISGRRPIAFAAAVFVSAAFLDREILDPMPGLNGRIVASIDAGRSVVLTEPELRSGNTYGGLSQVILYSTCRRGLLTPDQEAEVEMSFARSYVELHSGYQLERLLFEATDLFDIERAKSTRVWRLISDFADFHAVNSGNAWNRDRALVFVQKTDALSTLGSVAAFFFDYHKPILRFRNGDQQILRAAVEGFTDGELAQTLGLKLQTVKKRWASVFDHVAEVMPDLLPEAGDDLHRQTRGPQKRHHLLAYLRHHPEELRPMM